MEQRIAIVGAGPAGLSVALELARLGQEDGTPWRIAIFEKAAGLGEHSLSGAIVSPVALRTLFPDLPIEDLPFRAPVRGERVYLLGSRRAWRSMPREKSSPTARLRAAHRLPRCAPVPQPASSTRSPGCGSSSASV